MRNPCAKSESIAVHPCKKSKGTRVYPCTRSRGPCAVVHKIGGSVFTGAQKNPVHWCTKSRDIKKGLRDRTGIVFFSRASRFRPSDDFPLGGTLKGSGTPKAKTYTALCLKITCCRAPKTTMHRNATTRRRRDDTP